MLAVKHVKKPDKEIIDTIVSLHIHSFKGFFLSTLHPGFLRQLYKSFVTYRQADLLVAADNDKPVGFVAYSYNTTGSYRYMLWRYFFPFMWYSFLSFLKKPSIFFKLLSALNMPYSHIRGEDYVKIFSLGVAPGYQHQGVGSLMLDELKKTVDFDRYRYITLETDADNNENANKFYEKNGFTLSKEYVTFEGRKMNKYHYRITDEDSVS